MLTMCLLHENLIFRSYMEATLIMAAGSIPAFLVYYALVDYTLIESLSSSSAIVSYTLV